MSDHHDLDLSPIVATPPDEGAQPGEPDVGGYAQAGPASWGSVNWNDPYFQAEGVPELQHVPARAPSVGSAPGKLSAAAPSFNPFWAGPAPLSPAPSPPAPSPPSLPASSPPSASSLDSSRPFSSQTPTPPAGVNNKPDFTRAPAPFPSFATSHQDNYSAAFSSPSLPLPTPGEASGPPTLSNTPLLSASWANSASVPALSPLLEGKLLTQFRCVQLRNHVFYAMLSSRDFVFAFLSSKLRSSIP